MAYLHCHTCNWQQDDFWSESYNPITFLEKNTKDELLNGDLEKLITIDRHTKAGEYYGQKITLRELIAISIEESAKSVRNMEYRTNAEFKNDVNAKCPVCGNQNFDID